MQQQRSLSYHVTLLQVVGSRGQMTTSCHWSRVLRTIVRHRWQIPSSSSERPLNDFASPLPSPYWPCSSNEQTSDLQPGSWSEIVISPGFQALAEQVPLHHRRSFDFVSGRCPLRRRRSFDFVSGRCPLRRRQSYGFASARRRGFPQPKFGFVLCSAVHFQSILYSERFLTDSTDYPEILCFEEFHRIPFHRQMFLPWWRSLCRRSVSGWQERCWCRLVLRCALLLEKRKTNRWELL